MWVVAVEPTGIPGHGTFAIYDTNYDFMPAFHQTLVAVQLLFLRSDILVVPMSFLSAVAASLEYRSRTPA